VAFGRQNVSLRHKGLNILFVTELDDRYDKMGILNNRYGRREDSQS
jgi:hypothetical protein